MPRSESARVWKKRVNEARQVAAGWISKTDPYVRAYNGIFPPALTGDRADSVSVNYVLAVTRSLVSSLFFRNPKVSVPAKAPADLEFAHLTTAVLNRVLVDTGTEDAFALGIQDAILRGCGWVKYGFHTESAPRFDEEVVVNSADEDVHRENEKLLMNMDVEPDIDENHDKHIAGHQTLLDDPTILSNLMMQFGEEAALRVIAHIELHKRLKKQVAREGRLDWRVEPDEVWARYVDARDVIIDPNATSLRDARWIAFRVVRTVGSVKRDPAYKNTSSLEGGSVDPHNSGSGLARSDALSYSEPPLLKSKAGGPFGSTGLEELSDPDDEQIELFEIWDRQTETIKVVTDQSDRYLRNGPSPYSNIPGFFPAVQIILNDRPGYGGDAEAERPYGYSHIEPWWGEQLELNKMESVRLAIAKHNVPKYEVDSSVSDQSVLALTSGKVGVCVKVDRANPDAANTPAVRAISLQTASIDLHTAIMALRDSIAFKSGLSEIQLGQPSTARTATATQVQVASTSARVDRMLDSIENAFQHAARVILAIVRQYYTVERVVAIEGPEGSNWVKYIGSDLYGDEIVVDNNTSRHQNEALERHMALELFNLLAQVPQVKMGELLNYVLRKFGIPTPSIFLKTPEELAQEQQMMQMMAQQQGQMGQGPQPGMPEPGAPLDHQMAQQGRQGVGQLLRNASGDKLQSRLSI